MSRGKTPANSKVVPSVVETMQIFQRLLLFFWIIILAMHIVFLKNYRHRLNKYQSTKLSLLLSLRRNIPNYPFDVSSRVIDFNCSFLNLSVLFRKRHSSYEMLQNFAQFISLFLKYSVFQGEHLKILLSVY